MLPQRDLRIRKRGEDVVQLQNIPRKLNYSIEDAEGTFGRRNQDAVILFQRGIGLEPTGIVEQNTADRLRQALNRAKIAPSCP